MKRIKEVFVNSFKEYELSDEKIRIQKSILLKILLDIKFVCDKYNLNYYLGGGTLLGAVRHNGFIPWDDDIDINMFSIDLQNLQKYFIKEFGNKYFFIDINDKIDPIKFTKIMLTSTIEVEVELLGLKKKRGIGIDIFPIENTSDNKIKRKITGFFSKYIKGISSVVFDYRFPSYLIMDLDKKSEVRREYQKRRRIGFLFSFLPMFVWKKLFKAITSNANDKSFYVTIPSGVKGYSGEMYERSLFSKKAKYSFESFTFDSIENYDLYLTRLYKNYMEIPPIEKREKHIIVELQQGDFIKDE